MNRNLLPPALLSTLTVPPPALPGVGGGTNAAPGPAFSRALSDARSSVEPQGAEARGGRGSEAAPAGVAPRESESTAPREPNGRSERREADASALSTPPAAAARPSEATARRPGTQAGTPAARGAASAAAAGAAAAAAGDTRAQAARARARAAAEIDAEAQAAGRLPGKRGAPGEDSAQVVADTRAVVEPERQCAARGADQTGTEIAGGHTERAPLPAGPLVAATALAGGQRDAAAGANAAGATGAAGAAGPAKGVTDVMGRVEIESTPGSTRLARDEGPLLGAAASEAAMGARGGLADAANALAAAAGASGRNAAPELGARAERGGASAITPLPTTLAGAWGTGAAPGLIPANLNSAPPAEATLTSALGSEAFARDLGAQVSTFVREGVQQARLQLNPQDLGPVLVRIQLEGQTAQVHMSADLQPTRQALEQALPALASQLSEAGITLTGGGVFEQATPGFGAGERQPRDDATRRGGTGSVDDSSPGAQLSTEPLPERWSRARGIVDLVA